MGGMKKDNKARKRRRKIARSREIRESKPLPRPKICLPPRRQAFELV
jgi:hypothetical protein